jgi:hypothetical protein
MRIRSKPSPENSGFRSIPVCDASAPSAICIQKACRVPMAKGRCLWGIQHWRELLSGADVLPSKKCYEFIPDARRPTCRCYTRVGGTHTPFLRSKTQVRHVTRRNRVNSIHFILACNKEQFPSPSTLRAGKFAHDTSDKSLLLIVFKKMPQAGPVVAFTEDALSLGGRTNPAS